MNQNLTPKLREMLTATKAGEVEFSPTTGRHNWWWHKPGTTGQGSRVTTHMVTLVGLGLVKPPKPRASGTARLTDEGESALEAPAA